MTIGSCGICYSCKTCIYICSGWLSVFSSHELGDSSPESPSFNVVKLIKCEYRNMLDEDSLYNVRNKLVRLCHVDKHTGHPKSPELAGTARVLSGCRHPCQQRSQSIRHRLRKTMGRFRAANRTRTNGLTLARILQTLAWKNIISM